VSRVINLIIKKDIAEKMTMDATECTFLSEKQCFPDHVLDSVLDDLRTMDNNREEHRTVHLHRTM
jgi:hypothetical protein